MGDRNQGLYPEGKYIIRRVDGSDAPGGKHYGCRAYVLDVTHDPHAIPALRAYATSCERDGYELLARDLRRWADESVASPVTAPVAPPAPDLRQAIEEAEEALTALSTCRLTHDSCICGFGPVVRALRSLLAASRAAMEERGRITEAVREFASQYGIEELACRYDNGCVESGREPMCPECALRTALAPAAKEENRNG